MELSSLQCSLNISIKLFEGIRSLNGVISVVNLNTTLFKEIIVSSVNTLEVVVILVLIRLGMEVHVLLNNDD